jgi:DNA-binding transcriptional ArsR family regulator
MLNFYPGLPALMAALSDPTRLAIVEALSLSPLSVSEIAAPFDMSLAAIVQHIQVLEKAGAVKTVKQGRTRRCMIDPRGMAMLRDWLNDRECFWQGQFDNLEAMLDAEVPNRTMANDNRESET